MPCTWHGSHVSKSSLQLSFILLTHVTLHLVMSIFMLDSHGRGSHIQVLIAMQVQQLVQQGDAGLARLSQLHPQIAWPSGVDSAMAPAEVCADGHI